MIIYESVVRPQTPVRLGSRLLLATTLLCALGCPGAVSAQDIAPEPAPATPASARVPPPPPPPPPPRTYFDARAYRESERAASRRGKQQIRDTRPTTYGRRRALGFVALGTGGTSVLFGLSMLLSAGFPVLLGESAGQQDLTASDKRMIGIPVAVGLPLVAVGLWAVMSPRSETRAALSLLPDLDVARTDGGLRAGLLLKLRL